MNSFNFNLLRLFIIISIVLPAGSLYNIPLKIISLVVLIFAMMLYRKGYFFSNFLIKSTPFLFFILIEVIYSLIFSSVEPSLIISQAKDIFIYYLMFLVGLSFINVDNIETYIIDSIVYALALVGLVKLLIIFISIVSGIPVSIIVKGLSDVFNVALMTYDLENSAVARINMPSDSLILVPVFFLMIKFIKGNANRKDVFCFTLILFSALITMSRYQWATTCIAILLAMFSYIKSKKILIITSFIGFILIFLLSSEVVQQAIEMRFSSQTVSYSDGIRNLQEIKINNAIDSSPILGNGLGYFLPDLIRNSITLYAYELQIPALIMQIGYVGFVIISLFTFIPIVYSSIGTKFSVRFSIYALAGIWFGAAFFNPVLFSSSGGAGLLSLFYLSRLSMFRNRTDKNG